jgi:hypothetical protein
MVSIEIVALVLTGLGLTASIIYYANIIQNAEKARQRELIYQKYQNISVEYSRAYNDVILMTDWSTYDEFAEKYGRLNNPEAAAKWMYITRVYNLAGVHLEEGADPELLFKLYPPAAIINLWELVEPIFVELRIRYNDPDRAKAFELLYNEARKKYPDLKTVNR